MKPRGLINILNRKATDFHRLDETVRTELFLRKPFCPKVDRVDNN